LYAKVLVADIVAEPPAQIVGDAPIVNTGNGFTFKTKVLLHPVIALKVIVVVPTETEVTKPD
jgi:hypothetical protein